MTHWNDPPKTPRLPTMSPRLARWAPWIAVGAIVIGGVFGIAFIGYSLALGGDAINGFERNGHYFVSAHGADTEVSQSQWLLSRTLGVLTYVTFPVAFAAMAFLLFSYVFPYFMYGTAGGRPDAARVREIEATGRILASSGSGGRLGDVNMSRGMLTTSVYERGIVLKPTLMPAVGIPVSEIQGVRAVSTVFGVRVAIDHDGMEVSSPVTLFVGPDSDVAQAIDSIRRGVPVQDKEWHELPRAIQPPSVATATRGVMNAMNLMGLVVTAVLIAIGVLWAIPTLGGVGVIWTVGLVVILLVNGYRTRRGT
jgi:hypothetical protein